MTVKLRARKLLACGEKPAPVMSEASTRPSHSVINLTTPFAYLKGPPCPQYRALFSRLDQGPASSCNDSSCTAVLLRLRHSLAWDEASTREQPGRNHVLRLCTESTAPCASKISCQSSLPGAIAVLDPRNVLQERACGYDCGSHGRAPALSGENDDVAIFCIEVGVMVIPQSMSYAGIAGRRDCRSFNVNLHLTVGSRTSIHLWNVRGVRA